MSMIVDLEQQTILASNIDILDFLLLDRRVGIVKGILEIEYSEYSVSCMML